MKTNESVAEVDSAKHGQGLRALVEARRLELERELAEVDEERDGNTGTRAGIDAALSALKTMVTGDLDQISPVVAAELSRWLESTKFLGAKEKRHSALRAKWAKLNEDDLGAVDDKLDGLVGRLQQRYGLTREQAEKEVDAFVKSVPTRVQH